MEKYCKKLVSKCIYIQILKCTETDLLGQFMEAGGWKLVHGWLKEGIDNKNWPLVQELLELLLLCPVDVPRLQSNDAPRLVKGLSREGSGDEGKHLRERNRHSAALDERRLISHLTTDTKSEAVSLFSFQPITGVRILAAKLVEQWLKIAKGETMTIASQNTIVVNKDLIQIPHSPIILNKGLSLNDSNKESTNADNSLGLNEVIDKDDAHSDKELDNEKNHYNEGLVFKLTVKDGKQILSKVSDASPKKGAPNQKESEPSEDGGDGKSRDDAAKTAADGGRSKEERSRSKEHRSQDKSRKLSSSSSSHKSGSSGSKSSSKHSSSSSSSKSHKSGGSSSSKSSSSSSRDKSKDRHSSSKSSSSRDKDRDKSKSSSKMSQADKDKDTLAKVLPQSLNKLAKIPKKSSSSSTTAPPADKEKDKASAEAAAAARKKSISIEVRKTADRPKTVKAYNGQFRSHGLAEEAPPPPSRKDLKKPSTTPTPGASIPSNPVKRSLSPTNAPKEAEKKIKLASPTTEKPGAIKLIPPKPKRKYPPPEDSINFHFPSSFADREPELCNHSGQNKYTKYHFQTNRNLSSPHNNKSYFSAIIIRSRFS